MDCSIKKIKKSTNGQDKRNKSVIMKFLINTISQVNR